VPIAIFVALAIGFTFFATAGTWHFTDTGSAYFDALGRSFLQGHLYLEQVPSPELLALANPYDPAQRSTIKPTWPWDISLHNGHFYLYWGPAPAILHAAWHLVFQQPLLEGPFAVAVALGCCLVFWLLLEQIKRRAFPDGPRWLVWGCVLAFGLGGMMPYLVARPGVYHTPILLAALLMLAALYCLSAVVERRAGWTGLVYCVLAGALLGWAVAARISYVAYAGAIGVVLAWILLRRPADRGQGVRQLVGFSVPLALSLALLLAYNWARFESPFEFGQKYQLAGTDQTRATSACGRNLPGYVGLYFLSIPRVQRSYPFIPFRTGPAVFNDRGPSFVPTRLTLAIPQEPPVLSSLLLAPLGLLLLAAPRLGWRTATWAAAAAVVGAAAIGVAATTGVLSCAGGVDARYYGDLTLALTLAGSIVLLALSQWLRQPRIGPLSRFWRRGLYTFAVASWLGSIAIGLLLGTMAWLYWAPEAVTRVLGVAHP
jgi:hypothetical protein